MDPWDRFMEWIHAQVDIRMAGKSVLALISTYCFPLFKINVPKTLFLNTNPVNCVINIYSPRRPTQCPGVWCRASFSLLMAFLHSTLTLIFIRNQTICQKLCAFKCLQGRRTAQNATSLLVHAQ